MAAPSHRDLLLSSAAAVSAAPLQRIIPMYYGNGAFERRVGMVYGVDADGRKIRAPLFNRNGIYQTDVAMKTFHHVTFDA